MCDDLRKCRRGDKAVAASTMISLIGGCGKKTPYPPYELSTAKSWSGV